MINRTSRQLISIIVVLAGFFIAFTQFFGESRDYVHYEAYFSDLMTGGIEGSATRFEPGFVIISYIVAGLAPSAILIYAIIAAGSLYLKLAGCSIYTAPVRPTIFALLITLYLVRYFPLHELTQLRVALAIGVIIFGIKKLDEGDKFWGMALLLAAPAFHYSLLTVVPFVFLTRDQNRAVILRRALIAGIGLALVTAALLLVFAGYFQILQAYEENNQLGELTTNPFSAFVLLDLLTTVYMMKHWDALSKLGRQAVALQIFGLALFFALINTGVIAIRLREVFTIFYMVGFVQFYASIKSARLLPGLLVGANIALYAYTYFFYEVLPFFAKIN